jgi:hypothetical protein
MSKVRPAARPLELCQRLHGILVEYGRAEDHSVPQRRLFTLFAECGDPEKWTWAVWPSSAALSAVVGLYNVWCTGDYEIRAEMWSGLVEMPDDPDWSVLLFRAFAASGDPSEWPDFPTSSPELKRFLSEKYTDYLRAS